LSALIEFSRLPGGALYDGTGAPITAEAPRWDGAAGLIHEMPCCLLLMEREEAFEGGADLIYALPQVPALAADDLHVREVIAALDQGEVVALQAASAAAMESFLGLLEMAQ
jgi:hypothetical protein